MKIMQKRVEKFSLKNKLLSWKICEEIFINEIFPTSLPPPHHQEYIHKTFLYKTGHENFVRAIKEEEECEKLKA